MGIRNRAGTLRTILAAVALQAASGSPKSPRKSVTTSEPSVVKRPPPVENSGVNHPWTARHQEEDDKVSSELKGQRKVICSLLIVASVSVHRAIGLYLQAIFGTSCDFDKYIKGQGTIRDHHTE